MVDSNDSNVVLSKMEKELLCSLSEEDLLNLIKSPNEIDLREIVKDVYLVGRLQLAERLSNSAFLTWIDESSRLGAADIPRADKNPFPHESSALDAFHLSQKQCFVEKPLMRVPALQTNLVRRVRDRPGPKPLRGEGCFHLMLGVSEAREEWAAWAGDDKEKRAVHLNKAESNNAAFVPSMLFICVGIATIIILTNFVQQTAVAVEVKGTLSDVVSKISTINDIFQSLAIACLNLATCVDPIQLKVMAGVKLATYSQQLVEWSPVATEITQVKNQIFQDPDPFTLLQDLPGIFLASFSAVLENVTRPEVLSTIPVYGPTLQCVFGQLGSNEVQTFLNKSTGATEQAVQRAKIRIATPSNDTCRFVQAVTCLL
jgi:hypothetical protein